MKKFRSGRIDNRESDMTHHPSIVGKNIFPRTDYPVENNGFDTNMHSLL